MREIIVKLYQFDELSDKAKEKARDWWREGGLDYEWWDCIYEDAERIGLKITGFDAYGRYIEGDLTKSVGAVCRAILAEHGKSCNTYKIALDYCCRKRRGNPYTREDFLHDLLEEYLTMLRKEAEYLMSDEHIDETIRANEYEFTEDGKQVRS